MGRFPIVIFITVLVTQVYTAPQFISFNDGKLGVNFAGYHAAVGLGGIHGNGGSGGGLYAEAGTPYGQAAKAGLGGAADANGGSAGGLYAGATAGGNIKAAAGLAGGVNGGTSAGTGFAAAQAGNRYSTSTLIGKSPVSSTGFLGGDNNGFPNKNIATNELQPLSDDSFKTSDVNGFDGPASSGGQISPQLIQKRVDIGTEHAKNDGFPRPADETVDQVYYKKEVKIGQNPNFFEDIFNIPIAALTAVRTFLTNTAGNTSVSVQKAGSLHADSISPKHASSVTSSGTQISVKTPNASQLLDDILAIPINTLGAVNKFLENNVPVRKRVSIENGEAQQILRIPGRHARRRALKKEIIEQNKANVDSKTEATN